jgi:hypothetical protein
MRENSALEVIYDVLDLAFGDHFILSRVLGDFNLPGAGIAEKDGKVGKRDTQRKCLAMTGEQGFIGWGMYNTTPSFLSSTSGRVSGTWPEHAGLREVWKYIDDTVAIDQKHPETTEHWAIKRDPFTCHEPTPVPQGHC